VSFKHVRITYFFINAIKKICEKYILLKQCVLLTCQKIHINLICELYKIYYKLICKKFMSHKKRKEKKKELLQIPIGIIELCRTSTKKDKKPMTDRRL
jgi:hypothetical protein